MMLRLAFAIATVRAPGVMLIDDLSVAKVPKVVSGNFWVNSDFESGTGLQQTNGNPANWNRGGSDGPVEFLRNTGRGLAPRDAGRLEAGGGLR